jgi:probable rRNA maturation factor
LPRRILFKQPEKIPMLEIVNNQRKVKIDLKSFEEFAENTVRKTLETGGKSVTIAFVSDRKMRFLNKTFRGKDATTDVLSFPFEAEAFERSENNLGDIFISLEQAGKQASENNLDFETEIKQLILHGILHLCGFDHETDNGEMNRRELRLRKTLRI